MDRAQLVGALVIQEVHLYVKIVEANMCYMVSLAGELVLVALAVTNLQCSHASANLSPGHESTLGRDQ